MSQEDELSRENNKQIENSEGNYNFWILVHYILSVGLFVVSLYTWRINSTLPIISSA